MTWRYGLHAFEQSATRTQREEIEEMIEPTRIGLRRHRAGRDQRFDLGTEIEEIAAPREEQGTDADAIPGEQHRPAREVDKHEGKLPFEEGEQLLAMLLVEMNDQLGVAVGAEHVALGLELDALLGIIEQLAIADDGDAAILVEDRLLAVLEPENAQPAMRKPDPRHKQKAGIIRTTVSQRVGHAAHERPIGLSTAREVNHSCQAAHIAPPRFRFGCDGEFCSRNRASQ